jgi:hypothetical protein
VTLLVAGLENDIIWMVADTFVTGGSLDARAYEHQIKIVPSLDGKALIGFAGEQLSGESTTEHVRLMPAGTEAISHLLKVANLYPVDFAYGYMDQAGRPHLLRISSDVAEEVTTLNIGVADAFSQFQAIRHRVENDPVPLSISTFMLGTMSADGLPVALGKSIRAMLLLFSERSNRDVGGAVIPYVLGNGGAFLCGYVYSVSDPITDKLAKGALIPHGTADEGGFGLSVTDWEGDKGIVLYWLQKPGGLIFLRNANGYKVLPIDGTPSSFREQALVLLGTPVHIWFGDAPPMTGKPDSLSVVRDEDGKPVIVLEKYGRNIQLSAIDASADFRTKTAKIDMSDDEELSCSLANASLTSDGDFVTVRFQSDGMTNHEINCSASQLDSLIAMLGAARARMRDQVTFDPLPAGKQEMMVIDPAWRTDHSVHASLDGLFLRLRHIGLGWVSFLLPHHEAIALAEWLSKNARRKDSGSQVASPPQSP